MKVKDKTYEKLLEIGFQLDQLAHGEFEVSETKTELQEMTERIFILCHQLKPQDPKPLDWLAMLYIHTRNEDDLDKAEEILKKAYKMKDRSRHLQIEIGLGNVYRLKDQYEKAIEHYKKALKRKNHPVIYSNIALTYDKWNKREKAVEWAKKGLDVLNSNPKEFGEQTKKELEEIKDTGLDWDDLRKKADRIDYEVESKRRKYKLQE